MLIRTQTVLIMLIFIFSLQVKASISPLCSSLFEAPRKISFSELPSAIDLPLSPDFLRLIDLAKESPRYKEVLELLDNDTSRALFGLEYYRYNNNEIATNHYGESIAAGFISKVLLRLFPGARLEPATYRSNSQHEYVVWKARNPEMQPISLAIRDPHETYDTGFLIDMMKIKSANPGLGNAPHRSFRAALGVPQSAKIVSLYALHLDGVHSHPEKVPSVNEVLKKINSSNKKNGQPAIDIFFISGSGGAELSTASIKLKNPNYNVIKLSEFHKKYSVSKKTIVVNDMSGRMPQILNISDLAVVIGPINISEPTTAGTPLIFFQNEFVLGNYRSKAFEEVAEVILKGGGAKSVSDTYELESIAGAFLNQKNKIIPPYLTKDEFGLTPVDHLVDHLLSKIVQMIKASKEIEENIREENEQKADKSYWHY